jgi:hypothetical protein
LLARQLVCLPPGRFALAAAAALVAREAHVSGWGMETLARLPVTPLGQFAFPRGRKPDKKIWKVCHTRPAPGLCIRGIETDRSAPEEWLVQLASASLPLMAEYDPNGACGFVGGSEARLPEGDAQQCRSETCTLHISGKHRQDRWPPARFRN